MTVVRTRGAGAPSAQAAVASLVSPGPHLPATTHSYLLRAAASLAEAVEARGQGDAPTSYALAHVAALRAAAALVAARAGP
ncbi:MAG: hypothetical protein QM595_04340, partial [Nocardioides sp.]